MDNPFMVGDRVVAARTKVIAHGRTGTVTHVADGLLWVRWDGAASSSSSGPYHTHKFDRGVPDHADTIAALFGV